MLPLELLTSVLRSTDRLVALLPEQLAFEKEILSWPGVSGKFILFYSPSIIKTRFSQ